MTGFRGMMCGIVTFVCMVGWAWAETAEMTKQDPNVAKVVAGNNTFGFELYGKLKGQEGNLFLSPYSISTALGMTYAGARGNTEVEMAKTLHFEPRAFKGDAKGTPLNDPLHPTFGAIIKDLNARQKKDYELAVANALWAQKDYKFQKEYVDLVKANYGAGLENVDFEKATEEARKTINAWVEKQTKDKIKEFFKPGVLDFQTRLVLTNAIYFKGQWTNAFDKKQTKDEVFHIANGRDVPVAMMHVKGRFRYAQYATLTVLELPYKGEELSMVVLLPAGVEGIGELEEKLTAEMLETWNAQMQKQEVNVSLPKFRMTSEFRLDETLKAMGMKDAFSPPPLADFLGMTGGKNLRIKAVVHKAYVDVNEEGTEAAAATGVAMGTESVHILPVFRADHPFFFVIRDIRTGSILFMGRVADPRG